MDKLDQYVEKTLMSLYTSGIRRAENKEYRAILKQIDKYKRQGNWEKVNELRKAAQQMPSKDPNDENFKRLYYVRYADDWLIGLSGSKQDAEEVKEKIKSFLKTELNLKLSPEKTLITHAREDKARFLSYDILHHVKKLKDIRRNGRKDKPEWMKRMIAMNRKTLAVCKKCHDEIHAGKFDGKKVR
jgi:hypothetical protein